MQAMISKKFWPSFKPDMSRYDAKVEAEKATRRELKSELTKSLTESLTASLTATITESTRSSMEVELRAPIAEQVANIVTQYVEESEASLKRVIRDWEMELQKPDVKRLQTGSHGMLIRHSRSLPISI